MSLYRKGPSNGPTYTATPFAGWIDGVPAVSAPHVLVSGPSGVGKSRRVIVPAILMWGGPVVAISSKPDLIELALQRRLEWGGYGKTYVLDLSGKIPDSVLPPGVEKVVSDPVALITDDDSALDLAEIMLQCAGLGSGSQKKGDPFWDTISTPVLAGLLRAAGPDGVAWARAAVSVVAPPGSEEDDDTDDKDAPCWINAVGRLEKLGSEIFMAEVESAVQMTDKMRDSVMATMKSAIAPWWRRSVQGSKGARPFTPDMLEDPAATLFMVAPAKGVAAAAAVGTVDAISNHWREGQTRPTPLPHMLVAVDELCNTLPWQALPVVVTEARAMGISVLAAVQSTKQFARRFGHDIMEELRAVFPSTLLLCGAPEKEICESAAWAHGRTERIKLSVDHNGNTSQSTETDEVFHGADLLPQDINHGRLLRGSRPGDTSPKVREAGLLVDLFDLSELPFAAPVSV